ncbi:antitoxin [Fusobacterium sp.]|uniref:antitoxin n=1 Tax=Fusobacterium sp. TaxID=68766 RepID=UPI000C6FE284|nr:antitoxin [Fusobacterium sp.]
MDNLIITVGTSLIENYIAHNHNKDITKENILHYYEKERIEDLRDKRFGSEIVSVENLREKGIFSGKRLYMINHDTVNGKLAGEVLEEFFIKKGIVQEVIRKSISKVDKRHPVAFRTEGLKNLVEEIGNIVEQVANKYNVAVCTVGGYTAEIFMVSLMAQILGIKSYFMFREFEDVTEIPPLPIKLDYNYYLENKEFFNIIATTKPVEKSAVEKYLKQEVELSYFVEEIKKEDKTYLTLSAIGYYYLKTVKSSHNLPRRTSNINISDKEIPSSSITARPPELEEMIKMLKASPYVNKLKVVFYNPNRRLKVSKFFILDSDDFESALALELKTSVGGFRIDIYTVATTKKEHESLMIYFNENFL